jgi:hypothetical protein
MLIPVRLVVSGIHSTEAKFIYVGLTTTVPNQPGLRIWTGYQEHVYRPFGRLFTSRLCGLSQSRRPGFNLRDLLSNMEQNLQYGLLIRIGISLNRQQVRACSSNLL